MGRTSTERRLLAEAAAHESWARTADRSARTANARKASADRFERLVDPDGVLDPKERAIRAASARKAHFARMAAKSAQVRRERAGGTTASGINATAVSQTEAER